MNSFYPPVAPVCFRKLKAHKTSWLDPYYWMRDRGNKYVLDHLKAENSYTDKVMKETLPLQKKLYREMVRRMKETDSSVPVKIDDYFYYTRTEKGKQYLIYCRKWKSLNAKEEILLDGNKLAKGKSYFDLGICETSPDHQVLAYSVDFTGAETYELFFRDLKTGKEYSEKLSGIGPGGEWAEDNQHFFYITLDQAKRPYKIFRHSLGTKQPVDKLVFHEKNEMFFASVGKTKDRKWLLIETASKITSEVWFWNAARPLEKLRLIQQRKTGVEYSVDHRHGLFYITTNDRAKDFRILTASTEKPQKKYWTEWLSARKLVKIEDLELFENHAVLFERDHGLHSVRVFSFKNKKWSKVHFSEPVYTIWSGTNVEPAASFIRIGYNSLVTPSSVIDIDLKSLKQTVRKRQQIPSGYNPEKYQTKRILVPSSQTKGCQIPVSLVWKKELNLQAKNRLLLYGYGSYGISIDPEFSSNRLSLLDRGFIFAIAHVRGGGDMGREWYENGKFLKKKNTFHDFIDCADYLIKNKYTEPAKLAACGGSAGGMLMGVICNWRPELFGSIIAKVPFVDVVNTMLDPSLPLTVTEYEEWGNPNQKKFFRSMQSYSPYEHVKSQAYPHILVTGGLNDPRVQYWEPAKWVAKVRALKTDRNLLLLKMEMGAGHGGPSGRYNYLKEIAFDYAFLLKTLEK